PQPDPVRSGPSSWRGPMRTMPPRPVPQAVKVASRDTEIVAAAALSGGGPGGDAVAGDVVASSQSCAKLVVEGFAGGGGARPCPRVAIVTSSLSFDWSIPLFAESGPDNRPLIITGASANPHDIAEAEEFANVMVAGDGAVDLGAALQGLANLGLQTVLCEGGP